MSQLFRQLQEGAGQIALKTDFADDGLIGMVVETIKKLFGVDLSDFFNTVDNLIVNGVKAVTDVVNQVVNIFNGVVVEPINQALANLMDWFTRLGGFDQSIGPDLAELQDRTQVLEGVIGYAHSYCNGGFSSSLGDFQVPVDRQIGANVGTTFFMGGVLLLTKGLWVADFMLNFHDYTTLGSTYTNAQVRIYAPDHSLHSHRIHENDDGNEKSHIVHIPFTTPTAGYYVQAWGNAAYGRGVKGGSVWNGLSVEKRSSEST